MTIEFPCPQCSQLVRTPDAAAGKKGKCPSCQAVMQIPAMQTPAAQQPAALAVATKPTADTGPIEFFCTFCGQVVRTPRTAAGKKGKCPHCSEVVLIPLTNPPKPATPAAKPAAVPATPQQPTPAPAKQPVSKQPAPSSSAPALQPLAPLTPLAALTPLSSGGDLFGGPAATTKPTPQQPAAKAAPRPATPSAKQPAAQPAAPALAQLTPLMPLAPLGEGSAATGGDLFGGPLPSQAAPPATNLAPLAPLGAGSAGGDLFGGGSFSANPYADSSYKPAASASPSTALLNIPASLNIPAIIQLVVVVPFLLAYVIYFGLCLLSLVISAFTLAAVNPQFRSLAINGFMYNGMWTVLTLVFMVGQCVIILGSIRQLERKGLQMAQIGAWLSVVPCVSPMGMPAGIWSLVGLYRDEVKRSFRS